MAISLRPISSEKTTVACLCLIAADRAKSSAQRRLADRGSGGDDDHLAGVQAVGELVELGEAGGHADHLAAREPDAASISSTRGLEDVAEDV